MLEISRRDYDANSITIQTNRSRSVTRRRGSSGSRLGRHSRMSQLPPFALGTLSSESSVRQKRNMKDLVISISRSHPTTIVLTPRSSSGGSFRMSGSYETAAQGQVMIAQRAVRPWPVVPIRMRVEDQQQKAIRSNSLPFNKIPPPPAVPPPVPPPGLTLKMPSEDETEPQIIPSEPPTRTAASSVIYGSDIVRGKRRYDPTRTMPDMDDLRRSALSSALSPNTTRERWSNVSGWPRTETEYHGTTSASHHASSSRRRKDTFGAKSRRSAATHTTRRASLDLLASMPNIPFEYGPESPSTAPASHMSVVPVVPAPILSPPLVSPNAGRNAMATGVIDPTSSTRVRFGARPMRSALLADGFREPEEDRLPRRLLQPDGSRGFDKFQ